MHRQHFWCNEKTEPWQDLGLPVGRGDLFLASQQVSLLEVTNRSSFTLSVYKPNFFTEITRPSHLHVYWLHVPC